MVALVADQQRRMAKGKGAAHVCGQRGAGGIDDIHHHAGVAVLTAAAEQPRTPILRRRAVGQRRQPLARQRDGGHDHPNLEVRTALAKRLERGQGKARLSGARRYAQYAPAAVVLPRLQALFLPAVQRHVPPHLLFVTAVLDCAVFPEKIYQITFAYTRICL